MRISADLSYEFGVMPTPAPLTLGRKQKKYEKNLGLAARLATVIGTVSKGAGPALLLRIQ